MNPITTVDWQGYPGLTRVAWALQILSSLQQAQASLAGQQPSVPPTEKKAKFKKIL